MYDVWGGKRVREIFLSDHHADICVAVCQCVCVPVHGQPCRGELFSRNSGGAAGRSGVAPSPLALQSCIGLTASPAAPIPVRQQCSPMWEMQCAFSMGRCRQRVVGLPYSSAVLGVGLRPRVL